jgi:hypothetical protein
VLLRSDELPAPAEWREPEDNGLSPAFVETAASPMTGSAELPLDEQLRLLDNAGEETIRRLQQQTEIIFASIEHCRKELERNMAEAQDRLLRQCAAQAEQLIASCVETAIRSFSEQIAGITAEAREKAERCGASPIHPFERRYAAGRAEPETRIGPSASPGEPL